MQRSEVMSVSESVTQIPAVTAVRNCLQVKHRSHNPSLWEKTVRAIT